MAKNIEKTYAKIIARAWKDPKFKAKLLKNPRAVLEEMGIKIDPDIQLRVVEEKPNTRTLVLPSAVSGKKELSEKEIAQLAAGAGKGGCTFSDTNCPYSWDCTRTWGSR